MKKALLLATILLISVVSTACINNFAVQELNNKAKTFLDKGDYENAIGRLQASLDLDATVFETHYNLGVAYTQAQKYHEAIDAFSEAIKIKSDFPDAYYSLAVAQENFAKDILNGTLTVEGKLRKELDSDDDADESIEELEPFKPSAVEKKEVVNLYEKAIEAYETYLEKGTELKDRAVVETKIESLKKDIETYQAE